MGADASRRVNNFLALANEHPCADLRYLLRLLPMGEVPFTTADDRREAAATGVCQPQRLTGPPVRAH